MSKVIQIRDVPEDVHTALTEAAQSEGLSLTRYMLRELTQLAQRADIVKHNGDVIRRTQDKVAVRVDRETILTALHQGRGDTD